MASTLDIKIHSDFNQLLTWFLSTKSLYIDEQEPWNISLLANNISFLYKNLPISSVDLKVEDISINFFREEEYLNKDKIYLSPIVRLKEYVNSNLKSYLCDFLIHGSMATLDYSKGWSDLDTFVILNSDTLLSPDKLINFRYKIIAANDYLLQIDVHQHHGFIFCSEIGLRHYYSHYLPLEVLRQSKSLLPYGSIRVHSDRKKKYAIESFRKINNILFDALNNGVLKHHKYQNEYLQDNFRNLNTMYQLKYFLSVVMTLPTYYLDAKGLPTYKSESFDKVKHDFIQDWEIIEKATKIRELWPGKEDHPYKGNEIPKWIVSILGEDYFYNAYKLSNSMFNSLLQDREMV